MSHAISRVGDQTLRVVKRLYPHPQDAAKAGPTWSPRPETSRRDLPLARRHGHIVSVGTDALPNSALHNGMVTVQIGFERVRSTVRLQLDASADLDAATRVALSAMHKLVEVAADPAPGVLFSEVADGFVEAEFRFWSGARQLETKEARHAVIRRVLIDLRAAGVVVMASQVQRVEASPELLERLTARAAGPAASCSTPTATTGAPRSGPRQ